MNEARPHIGGGLPGGMIDRAAVRPTVGRTLAGLVRYGHLLRNLVAKDLKLKSRGSVLGFVWSLANPLLMIGVYTVAFTWILQIRTPRFVFYLMLGMLAWTYFANAIAMSAGAISDNGGLVRSVWFPRAVLPIATVSFNLAQYVLTALVFLPILMVVYGVAPAAPMIAYPLVVLLQTAFTMGLGLLLAVGTAFYRDVRHFVEVALPVIFWATPVVYEMQTLPERVRDVIAVMPLSPYVTAYHDLFFYRRWPDGFTWALAAAYAGVTLAAGLWLVTRVEDRLTEQV